VTRKKFYIISPYFPPENVIGAYRPYGLAEYLDKEIFDIYVLTTKKYPFDNNLSLNLSSQEYQVEEKGYLPGFLTKGVFAKFWRKFISFQYRFAGLLDPRIFWALRVKKSLKKSISKEGGEVILFCTYTPLASLILGYWIKKSIPNVYLILDFRDLWAGNHYVKLVSLAEKFAQRFEKSMVLKADLVTVISKGMAEDIRERYPSIDPYPLFNGYIQGPNEDVDQALHDAQNEHFEILYTGMLYQGIRDPEPLFKTIALYKSDFPKLILIKFYGTNENQVLPLAEKYGIQENIKVYKSVSRAEILKYQARADALLFLESGDPIIKGTLPGKLFEYLIAKRPILALGITKNQESGELITNTGTGYVCGNNTDLIKNSIEELMKGSNDLIRNEELIASYNRSAQVRQFQDFLMERKTENALF